MFLLDNLFFYTFFNLKKNLGRPKNYSKFPPLPQPHFTKESFFLGVFQWSSTSLKYWKTPKPPYFSSRCPVEMVEAKFSQNFDFQLLAFSLDIAVVIHPNGPKCLRN